MKFRQNVKNETGIFCGNLLFLIKMVKFQKENENFLPHLDVDFN
jgi:hypothetical protein